MNPQLLMSTKHSPVEIHTHLYNQDLGRGARDNPLAIFIRNADFRPFGSLLWVQGGPLSGRSGKDRRVSSGVL